MSEQNASGKRPSKSSKQGERKVFVVQDEVAAVKELMHSSVSADEKCPMLYKRYTQLVQDHKLQERKIAEALRKQLELVQQKDGIQTELTRMSLAKTKLESLCRELQKHSKAVVDESRLRAKEEEERREKFKVAIDDISVKMQENFQCSERLRLENNELSAKLQGLAEQYEEREKEFEKVLKQKQVELELLEVKLAQKSVAVAQERENNMAERQCFLEKSLNQQRRCEALAKQEADLKSQVTLYSEKFDEFQNSLNKSNEMFNTFRKEMDKLSKRLKEVEKDRNMWRTRCEKANQSLLKTAEECVEKDKIVQMVQAKKDKLEKLCRALQTERTELLAELKQLRGSSDDVEENGEHNVYNDDDSQDKVDEKLLDQKSGSPDQSEKNHDSALNDGVDMSHHSEAVSPDPHEDGSHDPHEDGSHDLAAEQTSQSSDVTASQNEVDMTD